METPRSGCRPPTVRAQQQTLHGRAGFLLLGFAVWLALTPSVATAATFTLFGPVTYVRSTGEPMTVLDSFSVPNPAGPYLARIESGGGGAPAVASATVRINGVSVVASRAFRGVPHLIEESIELEATNQIAVQLRGQPGGVFTLEILGIDDDPPEIVASASPESNAQGWNATTVTVSFSCHDAISGILSCPAPSTVSSEGIHTVTGTAVDRAGNQATISVTVRVDSTPPSVELTWPPAEDFGTDRDEVRVEGRGVDGGSGIAAGVLHDRLGSVALEVPVFSLSRSLDTAIPSGEMSARNPFRVEVTDRAGNRGEANFLVRHTLFSTTVPSDPGRTELSPEGLPTAIDRALIRFEASVSRDRIHEIVAAESGRVAGFFVTTNTALAIFETQSVAQLETVLEGVRGRAEVVRGFPLPFLEIHQVLFDNDSLDPDAGSAYQSIRSSEAALAIVESGLPLRPVRIAVIDSGFDDRFGNNDELAGIRFFDLCDGSGQEGILGVPHDNPQIPHGTWMTGILAAANNGSGSNGVIKGISTGRFEVSVFRTGCSDENPRYLDPGLILAGMDLILSGLVGQIDIVSMSFGGFHFAGLLDEFEDRFDSPDGRAILWVASGGNDDRLIGCREHSPSGLACDLDNVVSVGAFDPRTDFRWVDPDRPNLGSNHGAGISLSAPGVNVWTPFSPPGSAMPAYRGVTGTSPAAPLTTGIAALLLATNGVCPAVAKQVLLAESRALPDAELPEGALDAVAVTADAVEPCVVYDNGASTQSGGTAAGHFIAADDFQPAGVTRITGASVDVNDGPADENRRWDGTVEWWLFADAAGLPGALIASGDGQHVRQTSLVVDTFGFRSFTVGFEFEEAIAVGPGMTYWLALHMQSDYTSRISVFWDFQGSTIGHPSRSGGELIGGVPNFVDGNFAGTAAFDKTFRVYGK